MRYLMREMKAPAQIYPFLSIVIYIMDNKCTSNRNSSDEPISEYASRDSIYFGIKKNIANQVKLIVSKPSMGNYSEMQYSHTLCSIQTQSDCGKSIKFCITYVFQLLHQLIDWVGSDWVKPKYECDEAPMCAHSSGEHIYKHGYMCVYMYTTMFCIQNTFASSWTSIKPEQMKWNSHLVKILREWLCDSIEANNSGRRQ